MSNPHHREFDKSIELIRQAIEQRSLSGFEKDVEYLDVEYLKEVRQWVTEIHTLKNQSKIINVLLWAFVLSFAITLPAFLVAVFLSGRLGISDKIVMFLGTITIGELAGLLTTAITTFFSNQR